jgi:hypothetical protein
MLKKTFPPLLKAAFKKNNVDLSTNNITFTVPGNTNISTTGSRVKCYYPSPKEIKNGGFWTKKSPCILHAIVHQLPPIKYHTASELLDFVSTKV